MDISAIAKKVAFLWLLHISKSIVNHNVTTQSHCDGDAFPSSISHATLASKLATNGSTCCHSRSNRLKLRALNSCDSDSKTVGVTKVANSESVEWIATLAKASYHSVDISYETVHSK
jgi:hypothetical protein